MKRHTKRIYVLCDMEGASGISPANRTAMRHGSELWRDEGRTLVTSDVLAVCEAANEFGMDEIVLNDSHDYGHREPNVLVSELPDNVRLVRRPYLPGTPRRKARGELYGMIIAGQHAMSGGKGFAPHTIQSPPIGAVTINGIAVGEIGLELALFMGTKLLAIVGEEAAVAEARGLCPNAAGVPVKSLERDWFPPASETHPVIRAKVLEALRDRDRMTGLHLDPPYRFTLAVSDGWCLDSERKASLRWLSKPIFFRGCKGRLGEAEAAWTAKTIVGGVYALHAIRAFMKKRAPL